MPVLLDGVVIAVDVVVAGRLPRIDRHQLHLLQGQPVFEVGARAFTHVEAAGRGRVVVRMHSFGRATYARNEP